MKRWYIILMLGLACLSLAAQEVPPNLGQQLENLAALSDVAPDETLLLQLQYRQRHPLNLNTASADELKLFPFLSPLLIEQLLRYRSLAGPLVAVHELQAVPGWEPSLIRSLLPYITVTAPESWASWRQRLASGAHLLQIRWGRSFPKTEDYGQSEAGSFAGDPNQLLVRYLYRHPQGLQYGVVADKDAGETLAKKGRSSPDFTSFHLFARPKGWLKALALGDFTTNIGQGLVQWQALAFGKGPEVLAIKRQGPVLRPYASAGELYFLRGAGLTIGRGHWEATFFGARQKTDAITGMGNEGTAVITSFPTSGLHRTASEYASRRSVRQTVAGAVVQYRSGAFYAGLNGLLYGYALPIEKQAEPYNLYAPAGTRFGNAGTDFSYTFRNLHLFGEAALDYKRNIALVQGAVLSLRPQVDLSLLARHLPAGYTALVPNVFAETGSATNEQGWYMGMQVRLPHRIRMQAYADLYRWPWLRFRVAAPGAGSDYLLQVQVQPQRGSEGLLLLRSENKPANYLPADAAVPIVLGRHRQSARLQWSHALSNRWQLRCRAEGVAARLGSFAPTHGFLFFSDLQYRPPRWVTADLRLCWFDAADANARIFAYEQDVLYSYSIPGFVGKGWRGYINMRLKAGKDLDVWMRVAHTLKNAGKPMSANDLGRESRTDLKLQLVWQW
ncbi:Helix-hairpin-helix motif-containing protein [Cnuella takakiae]|uniref:Helix-hairpin-helix motif-containing protein n=1 Tax=Cnuella takakiae TaxID=1302690 RepID=A0A1M5C2H0_9BACT|nr:helix-hairpin-helix domain-containing protein [Cnuella takakiae]OLY93590.1 hypothetical protein BUE76_18205 [Cnuella takakiae]SHF48622.1 Helix-hairpin-helix motif-containing protein [Cnuella takakiae]